MTIMVKISGYIGNAHCHSFFVLALTSYLLMSCASSYQIDTYQIAPKQNYPYSSFSMMIVPDSGKQHLGLLKSIGNGFANNLKTFGLKNDSLQPELIFILRWEEHLVGRFSSRTSNETSSTYSITNPIYSPFENTSDRLKGSSSAPHRIRYYDKELFIRVQAIDATRNELIWSVKIYPHKKNGLPPESIPKVVRELADSFERVQFNIDKINQP
jgi:hypothetical protein